MKFQFIYYLGSIFGILYLSKSAIKQIIKFKSLSGDRSSKNYLLSKIRQEGQQSKGLQFFTHMYITGTSKRTEGLRWTNPRLKNYLLISQLGFRQGQEAFFSNKVVDRAPIFKLKNAYDLKVQVSTLNEFNFNLEKALVIFQENMSFWGQTLFNLGLIKREIIAGLPYNKQYLIFLGTSFTIQKLRQKLAEVSDYPGLRFSFFLSNIIQILGKIGMVGYLLHFLYKQIGAYLKQNIQDVLISQNHQTLKCFQCKVSLANIIYEPCFHMICCVECSQNQIRCPICQKKISKQIKVFND
ncbi:unnamed protein product (macronuclear) [Paramecium tetraurelia]|uniref:RING-type domain-containing protein n=1 Tax=Paramecium tetraurelia TaxID=5888 RepID=A0CAX1_PARTE|nr:uncharacterized protein GSPATT00036719001 [Paramecium tetraurelia]CAK67938.1 unnamed protein product [Paramecium tetraurelia]|eukprot:XP_001435335.1 hypothetical protein (macronuclear) [Paramecium tetraurelia strain d4-2]